MWDFNINKKPKNDLELDFIEKIIKKDYEYAKNNLLLNLEG